MSHITQYSDHNSRGIFDMYTSLMFALD